MGGEEVRKDGGECEWRGERRGEEGGEGGEREGYPLISSVSYNKSYTNNYFTCLLLMTQVHIE